MVENDIKIMAWMAVKKYSLMCGCERFEKIQNICAQPDTYLHILLITTMAAFPLKVMLCSTPMFQAFFFLCKMCVLTRNTYCLWRCETYKNLIFNLCKVINKARSRVRRQKTHSQPHLKYAALS